MCDALGIINSPGKHMWVEGLQDYRPIGAFSFLGRYRVIDFPISNMSNSGVERIQIHIRRKPRSLINHLGTGRHYNINSKRGRLQVLLAENGMEHDNYNTDIASYVENMEYIEKARQTYVVVAPSYMVYVADYSQLLEQHIASGADVTLLYHAVDDAKEHYLNCNSLELNRQKGVLSIERNRGTAKNRNIFMDTYIMTKEIFLGLIQKAQEVSSMFTLSDIINYECENKEMDIRGIAHKGFFASITDFKSYFDANLSLVDIKTATSLFTDEWPIYTKTNDSCPTQYYDTASVKSSVVSNGCQIEGTLENCIVGRGCVIKKGTVIKNSIILSDSYIGEDVHIENQVVDKHAKITRVKELVSDPEHPGYVRRKDTL